LRIPTRFDTDTLAQGVVNVLPSAIPLPATKVVVGRLPRWEVSREHAPHAAAADDVEDGVAEDAFAVRPRPAARLGGRDEGGED
jgi:hypothetical protein